MTVGLCAWTQPSGPVARTVYESLRDELLAQIRDALPLDIVVLVLHGAMLADGYPDCEGDLLARVRDLVGLAAPIDALLDLHGNVTPAMVASRAVLIACKFTCIPTTVSVSVSCIRCSLRRRVAACAWKPSSARADAEPVWHDGRSNEGIWIFVRPASSDPWRAMCRSMRGLACRR